MSSGKQATVINDLVLQALLSQGFTQADVARTLKVSDTAISQRKAKLEIKKANLNVYREHRLDRLDILEKELGEIFQQTATLLLKKLKDGKEELTIPNLVNLLSRMPIAYGTIFDKRRLESDKSTANTSIVTAIYAADKLALPSKPLKTLAKAKS